MSLDILLVNTNRIKPAIAPLAIDYLAEAAMDAGLEVDFLDLCFADDPHRAIAEKLAVVSPRLIALTFRNTDDCYMATRHSFIPYLQEIVRDLRRAADAPLVIGGAGFSVTPEGVLRRTGIDFGIIGDGEGPLVALIRALRAGTDFTHIPGLAWLHGDAFCRNAPIWGAFGQKALKRTTVDNVRYFAEGGQGSVETKRGCDGACVYCADPHSKGHCTRPRPPAAVADEVQNLLSMGIDVLHLCDSEFNLPREHAEAICEEFVRRDLGERVRWYAYLAPGPFDSDLAGLMRRAGCAGINFGTDHGDPAMLASLGRTHRPEDIRRAVAACKAAGIPVMLDLLLGAPGETLQSVECGLRLMQGVDPTCVGVAVGLRVYPDTLLAKSLLTGHTDPEGLVRSERKEDLCMPTFYLEPAVSGEIMAHIKRLVAGDKRYFVGGPDDTQVDYNYDDNTGLTQAIAGGAKGAYWDILRRELGL